MAEVMSLASRRLRFRLVFSILVVLSALLATWLIMADSSPLHNYFLWHGALRNIWAITTLIPFILGAMVAGNPHSPPTAIIIVALIIQWFLIGFLLSIPLSKLFVHVQKK